MEFASPTPSWMPEPSTVTDFTMSYAWPEMVAFVLFAIAVGLVVTAVKRMTAG